MTTEKYDHDHTTVIKLDRNCTATAPHCSTRKQGRIKSNWGLKGQQQEMPPPLQIHRITYEDSAQLHKFDKFLVNFLIRSNGKQSK